MRWPWADTCDAAASGRVAACWVCAGATALVHNAALSATRCQVDDFMGRHFRRRTRCVRLPHAAATRGYGDRFTLLRGCMAAPAAQGFFLKSNFWPATVASYIRPPLAIVKIAT